LTLSLERLKASEGRSESSEIRRGRTSPMLHNAGPLLPGRHAGTARRSETDVPAGTEKVASGDWPSTPRLLNARNGWQRVARSWVLRRSRTAWS